MTGPVDLKALIASIQRKQAEDKSLARAAAAVKSAKSSAAAAEAQAALTALRDKIEWTPAAVVFREERWQCACGKQGFGIGGLYLLLQHVREAGSVRLQHLGREAHIDPVLPKHRWCETTSVEMCPICAITAGHITRYTPPPRAVSPPSPSGFVAEWHLKRMSITPEPAPEPTDDTLDN